MRRYKRRLAEALNEIADLLLCEDAVECSNEIAHGGFAAAAYHMIDRLEMADVILPGNSPYMGLVLQIAWGKDIAKIGILCYQPHLQQLWATLIVGCLSISLPYIM